MMKIQPGLIVTLAMLCSLTIEGARIDLVTAPYAPKVASFGDSSEIRLSADGKWAVFTSTGNGLVAAQFNDSIANVFLRNLETGETILLSRNAGGNGGARHSHGGVITDDAGLILFESDAEDLFPNDQNNGSDIFIFDRAAGELTSLAQLVPALTNGISGAATITPQGRFVLFHSDANGLSPLDTNGAVDLYLLDRENREVKLVTVNFSGTEPAGSEFPVSNPDEFVASVSGDGRFVAFMSPRTNHTPGLPPGALSAQLYLRDMVSGTNAWLSRKAAGAPATGVNNPVVSPDGAYVAFFSDRLDNTGPNLIQHLYLYETASGTVRGVPSSNALAAHVEDFSLSGNSQFLAYTASNQVWLHDIASGSNRVISVDRAGAPASGSSGAPQISADGQKVVFLSEATNLVEGVTQPGIFQAYLFDAASGEIRLLSRSADGVPAERDVLFPVVSADGSTAGFMSYASNLVEADNELSNDLFVIPTSGAGAPSLASAPATNAVSATASGSSSVKGMSLDGRIIVFSSLAEDIVEGDTNNAPDLFLRDLNAGTNRLVSVSPNGDPLPGSSMFAGMSLDGRKIAYLSNDPSNTNGALAAFVYDAVTGSSVRASILPNGEISASVTEVALSPNGQYLAFRSRGAETMYIRDLAEERTIEYDTQPPVAFSTTGKYLITSLSSSLATISDWQNNTVLTNLTRLTHAMDNALAGSEQFFISGTRPLTGNSTFFELHWLESERPKVTFATNAVYPMISLDGSTILYNQLLQVTTNSSEWKLFSYDTAAGETAEVASAWPGELRLRSGSVLSADGRFAALVTTNSLTDATPDQNFVDIYLYDRVLNRFTLVSHNAAGAEVAVGANSPFLSADGRVVAFDSISDEFVANDRNLSRDIFVAYLSLVDSDEDGLEDGWELIHFRNLDADGDGDADDDGVSNAEEHRAGTDPRSSVSRFALLPEVAGEGPLRLSVPAALGRVVQLQHRASLAEGEWQNLGEPVLALLDELEFEFDLQAGPSGFFRLVTIEREPAP